jgi:HSP20 family protein
MTQLVKKEPESLLSVFRKDLDRFFEEFWGGRFPSFFEAEFAPPVEVGETNEEVFVNIQVPGMKKEEVNVQLTEGALSVKGERKEEKEEKKKNFYRREFGYGSFARTIGLPEEVEIDKAVATLDNGVLKVRIPKTEKARKRSVAVPIQ